ncbi:hypothetical protein [Phormidesmis sp. 146-33]
MTSNNAESNAKEPVFQTPDPTALNPNAGGESAKEKLEAAKEQLGEAESDPNLEGADPLDSLSEANELAHRQNIVTNISAG